MGINAERGGGTNRYRRRRVLVQRWVIVEKRDEIIRTRGESPIGTSKKNFLLGFALEKKEGGTSTCSEILKCRWGK